MSIKKPSWLHNWLAKFNFDILVWKLYIGDWIEAAIDWALGWINWAIERAGLAYSKAVEAKDKAIEVGREAWTNLQKEAASLLNKVDAWWSDLGEWWEGKRPIVQGWIDQAKQTLQGGIDTAQSAIDTVSIAWGNFRTQTLPKLLDPSWVTSFFGKGVASISDWWAPKDRGISEEIDAEVTPVRDEVNKHSSWLDLVKELFTDPEKWLLDMIERMLARFL